ncbi:MAG: hypothetical protein R3B70_05995 [Polyangiaceae bacterium]
MNLRWRVLHGFAVLIALLASACAGYVVTPAPMPTDPAPAGAARVCIVRVGADGALSTFPMRDNGVLVGATVGNSCFCYFAGEGRHELEARSDGFDTLDLDVKAQRDTVVLQATRAAVGIVRSRLEELHPEEAKGALKSCQYSVLTQVPEGTYKVKPNTVIVAK